MENKDAYTPDEIKNFIESRDSLNNHLRGFCGLYLAIVNESWKYECEKRKHYQPAKSIEEAERLLSQYIENSSENLREQFPEDTKIEEIKKRIERTREGLPKLLATGLVVE